MTPGVERNIVYSEYFPPPLSSFLQPTDSLKLTQPGIVGILLSCMVSNNQHNNPVR